MKFTIKKNIFLVLFVFLGMYIYSIDADKVIGSLTISGLNRTKESVIYNLLNVEEGDKISLFDEDYIKQEILKTGILRPGKITYSEYENYIDVNIEIKEKWTLIPIPIVSISGDNQYYGFVLLEQNFLGLRKLLFVQSGYSTLLGFTGGLVYRDMDILPGDMYLLTGGFLSNDSDNSYIRASGFLGIGKEFTRMKFQSQFKYDHFLFDNSEQDKFISNPLNFSYNDLFYTSTIQTGTKFSLTLTPGWDIEGSSMFFKLNSSMGYSKEISENLYLAVLLSSQYLDSPTLLEEYWGGSDNSRTLVPVLSDQYTGGSVLLEYAFLDFGAAVVSLMIQYELGGYQHDSDNWDVYTGPGAGLRLYLKKIAMPAIGFDVAYNTIDNNFLFSLTMGMKR